LIKYQGVFYCPTTTEMVPAAQLPQLLFKKSNGGNILALQPSSSVLTCVRNIYITLDKLYLISYYIFIPTIGDNICLTKS